MAVDLFVQFGDIVIESVNSLHGLFVLVFHFFKLFKQTFLPSDGLFVLLLHFDNFPFSFDKLFVFGKLLFTKLIVFLHDFFQFFLEPFDHFFVFGNIFILFGVFEQLVDKFFFLSDYFFFGFDLVFELLGLLLFLFDDRFQVHDSFERDLVRFFVLKLFDSLL